MNVKNLIVIGKIGSGKSALANVLSGTEVFKEDSSSTTEIWRAKDKEFAVAGTKYRVIDTVGFAGTMINEEQKKELTEKFSEEIGTYLDEGISQIFLLTGEKLDERVLEKFLWLNKSLFNSKALDYTSLIRNKFSDFEKEAEYEKDTKELINFFEQKADYQEFQKILEAGRVVYVDNSALDIEDEGELGLNKEDRAKSRVKLLDHLNKLNNKESYQAQTSQWLNQNYPLASERAKITTLDISKRKLQGRLSLQGFTNLKRLNCSHNQLTSLDFSDCPNLVELKVNDNQLTNLNFLKTVPNLEKLEIQTNHNFSSPGLKALASLSKLEELNITDTNLNEEWECLLKNCRKLHCDGEEITQELDKKTCSTNNETGQKYYNLDHWRKINQQNQLTAQVIPLERLFVIRSNIKKFVDKWGIRVASEEESASWYSPYQSKIQGLLKPAEVDNSTELSKLQSPEQFNKHWYWTIPQWTGRGAVGVGGLISFFYDYKIGAIAVASPIIETVTAYAKANLYEAKQKQWQEFVTDTSEFLNNYHELLGILEKIEISKFGEVNAALKELYQVTNKFSLSYDEDQNGTLDLLELLKSPQRAKLVADLNDQEANQLIKIIQALKNLEDEVTKYQQGVVDKDNFELKNELKQSLVNDMIIEANSNHLEATVLDLQIATSDAFLLAQIETPARNN